MSIPRLPEIVPDIDANRVSFTGGKRGIGQVWSLTRQFAKLENGGKLLLPFGVQKLKCFQLRGFHPLDH